MQDHKEAATVIDKGVYIIHSAEELKTPSDFSLHFTSNKNIIETPVKVRKTGFAGAVPLVVHFTSLLILGLLVWGLLWVSWGDNWSLDGKWFRLTIVAVIAWSSGQVLQGLTTLPPLIAALLTGILARHLNYLDMREFTHIDGFLRKIYPVVILGKGSLAWDVKFMRKNWKQVSALGVLPWTMEVVTLAVCMNLFLDYPWTWGVLLGSIYASVSCPVIMPSVLRIGSDSNRSYNWPQLVCTAGGTDTALSVGVYGIVYSFIFSNVNDTYRFTKVALTLFVGVALGVSWGSLAKFMPHSQDYYVTELRVMFVLVGGLFANFVTLHFGWGGVAGVAVLACNATAAMHWARDGWKLNNNAASTAYRVIWAACEPALFAYTGTYFEVNNSMSKLMLIGFGILLICLTVRLTVAALMCWDMTIKEKLFICCAWSAKSIVEAVLCPLALNTLISQGRQNDKEMEYAEHLMRLTVQAILITTPISFLLTHHLGPILLKRKSKDNENDSRS
ncbi:hypothetical protein K1T71_002489 [Dendrolimus kikuchii]|uniref:Uncharacterized protein n=1 Tax=Dendrolimus kikuchii TaxID=765133 RepID=A0ACC1DDV0_9NEOP|nr:hypothetical protein K1T71_002489 [Dendrolimus kikuchii]